MELSREDVLHIATLARVGVTEEDLDRFRTQLSNILENFEVLRQVDTENVQPTAQPVALRNVMRNDRQAPSFPQEQVLANAPQQEDGYFKVRAVLE